MKRFLAAAAVAAFAAGCSTTDEGAMADESGATTAAAAPGDLTPEERTAYVTMAGSSDLYEIQSGQLAQQRAQRAELKQFGQMLVTDHTNTTQQVMAAARASGMNPPPPALLPMHSEMLQQLQGASGAGFDRLFLSQQEQAHQMALDLHRNYASNGDTPQLQTVAGTAVPIITRHLEHVRQLRR